MNKVIKMGDFRVYKDRATGLWIVRRNNVEYLHCYTKTEALSVTRHCIRSEVK